MSGPLGFDLDDEEERRARPLPPPRRPTGQPERNPVLGGQSRYIVLVAAVFLLVIAYIGIRGHDRGVTARGLEPGRKLPPFAAPLATSRLEGDVNVAVRANQGEAGRVPACRLRGPDILNVCQLYDRGPVVLTFAVTGGVRCVRQLDVIERIRARHPGVQFAGVVLRGRRDAVRRTVRAHRWGFPVGYDHDGALAPLYGVVVCPLTTFALPGGRVRSTSVGELAPSRLERRVRALEAAARRGGWAPESSPGCACSASRARLRRDPGSKGSRSSCACCRTGFAVTGRWRCAASRCRMPTACSSAASGSTRT
jgi:hypothetical protein